MKKLLLFTTLLSSSAVDLEQRRRQRQHLTSDPSQTPFVEMSSGEAEVTGLAARPLQIDGRDGTTSTGDWKTMTTDVKSGSNVLIAEGLEREAVVADHQEFLKSDQAQGFDMYGTQYQTPYKPSKSRT